MMPAKDFKLDAHALHWKVLGGLIVSWAINTINIPLISWLAGHLFYWIFWGAIAYYSFRYRDRIWNWAKNNPATAIGLFWPFTMLGLMSVPILSDTWDWFLFYYFMAGCIALVIRLMLGRVRAWPWGQSRRMVLRGSQEISTEQLQAAIGEGQEPATKAQLELGGVVIPEYYENLSFFNVGAPGSGKSVALKRNLMVLRERDDWRLMILDRNGELMENFFDPAKDVIFNPRDKRCVSWSHRTERARPETLASAILPDPTGDDVFFVQGARCMLADLYKRCESNSQVWEIINTFSVPDLQDFLSGTPSEKYFSSEKTAGSILSTLVNDARFYEDICQIEPEDGDGFSFYHWAKGSDPRWVWVPLFEDDAEIYRPLVTGAFEMALKGLLSDEERGIRTGFVIDELGAIAKLKSLPRLLSESRKFLGAGFLGTQTEAQLIKTYGKEVARMILQGCATKLILNCRDYETAETFAKVIGKQEVLEENFSYDHEDKVSSSETIRDRFTVEPTELQQLQPLHGYLSISGFNPASVKLDYEPLQALKHQAKRLILREGATVDAHIETDSDEDSWWEE